jgi:hypothetical protein
VSDVTIRAAPERDDAALATLDRRTWSWRSRPAPAPAPGTPFLDNRARRHVDDVFRADDLTAPQGAA